MQLINTVWQIFSLYQSVTWWNIMYLSSFFLPFPSTSSKQPLFRYVNHTTHHPSRCPSVCCKTVKTFIFSCLPSSHIVLIYAWSTNKEIVLGINRLAKICWQCHIFNPYKLLLQTHNCGSLCLPIWFHTRPFNRTIVTDF